MAKSEGAGKKPLWLAIEEQLLEVDTGALSGEGMESTVHRVAGKLDEAGYNVSRHGGHMILLRQALEDMRKVGRPMLDDFNTAVEALTLDTLMDAYAAADKIINEVGATWPKLKRAEVRPVVIQIVEQRKLDLLVEKARKMPGDEGIELLINEKVDPKVITARMEITDDKLKEVNAEIEKRRAERERVKGLVEKVKDKSDEEKVRYLYDNNVSEASMIEIGGIDQSAIDAAKKAMEAELAEKQRLEEEAAAKRKAEAEGPSLEAIPADEMAAHIEAIREIMEFSDVEKEIRAMCEQSGIPKALIDVAVSDPDKLDELEKQAGG